MDILGPLNKMPRSRKIGALRRYPGYYEVSRRLFFPYGEDANLWAEAKAPLLLTVLPDGKIEGSKALRPQTDRALTFYIEPKEISALSYKNMVKSENTVTVDGKERRPDFAPFVDRSTGPPYSLAWTWPGRCANPPGPAHTPAPL